MGHTPGPWEVAIPGEVDEHYAVLDGFGHTASVYGHPEETSTALANARLIAAAPELLAACKRLASDLSMVLWKDGCGYTLCGSPGPMQDLLRDVIDKAEGRTE